MLKRKLYRSVIRKALQLDHRGLTEVALQRYAEFLPQTFVIEKQELSTCTVASVARTAFRYTPRTGTEASQALNSAFAFLKATSEDDGELEMSILGDIYRANPDDWLCALAVMSTARRMDDWASANARTAQPTGPMPSARKVYAELHAQFTAFAAEQAKAICATFVELCRKPPRHQAPADTDAAASGAADVPQTAAAHQQSHSRVADRATRKLVAAVNVVLLERLGFKNDKATTCVDPLYLDSAITTKRAHPLLMSCLYTLLVHHVTQELNTNFGNYGIAKPQQDFPKLFGTNAAVPLKFDVAVVGTPDRRRSMVKVAHVSIEELSSAAKVDESGNSHAGYINVESNTGALVNRKEAAYLMTGDAAGKSINSKEALTPRTCNDVLCGLMYTALVFAATRKPPHGVDDVISYEQQGATDDATGAALPKRRRLSSLLASLFVIIGAL